MGNGRVGGGRLGGWRGRWEGGKGGWEVGVNGRATVTGKFDSIRSSIRFDGRDTRSLNSGLRGSGGVGLLEVKGFRV